MNLREYLFRKRLSATEFARLIEYSRTQVSLVANERVKPSKRLAKIIERATDGNVSAEELLNPKVGDGSL